MDPKGPSAAFRRSSLKRSTSGSQKVRHMHRAHATGASKVERLLMSFHQIRWGVPTLISETVYLEMTSNWLWNHPSVQTVVSAGV